MARGSVNQGWVLGIESPPGAAGTLDTELMAYSIVPKPEVSRWYHRGAGRYAPTVSQTINEYMSAALEGIIDYRNLVYMLSLALGPATITQPDAIPSPTVYLWTWNLDGRTPINPVTATIEYGDTVRSGKFTYGHLNSLKMEMTRSGEGKLTADMLGRRTTPAATALTTAAVTAIAADAVAGNHWNFYSEANFAALTTPTNKLAELYKAEVEFSDLRSLAVPMDSAVEGFKDTVMGGEPGFMFATTLGANAAADDFLTVTARNDELAFFSAKATGDIIEDALPYFIKLDFAAFVDTFDAYGEDDGILTLPVDFTWAVDPVSNLMAKIQVQTDVVSL